MASKSDNPNEKSARDELAIYRCPHCGLINLDAGDQTFELSREDFMHFRDMVNEVAMDLPDRCSIHYPNRYDYLRN